MNALTNQVAYGVVRDLRVAAFDKLQTLPLSYIDSHGHGDLVSRIVTDIDQFSNGILMAFAQFFTGILTIAITLFFMFSLSVPVALVVVCLTPLSVFAAGFIARKTYAQFRVQSERRGAMTSIVEEMVGGISTVEAFGMEGRVCAALRGGRREPARGELQGDLLLLDGESHHAFRECPGLCRHRGVRVARGARRADHRRRPHRVPGLCEPVFQAVQRDLRGGHRAPELGRLRAARLRPASTRRTSFPTRPRPSPSARRQARSSSSP
ncbi:MAG: ABC transporter ATP-binding protein [Atopobiaceae bacterium]|nr:ABC transporter ATP-binding protein [Atopobiaceae bacterium]